MADTDKIKSKIGEHFDNWHKVPSSERMKILNTLRHWLDTPAIGPVGVLTKEQKRERVHAMLAGDTREADCGAGSVIRLLIQDELPAGSFVSADYIYLAAATIALNTMSEGDGGPEKPGVKDGQKPEFRSIPLTPKAFMTIDVIDVPENLRHQVPLVCREAIETLVANKGAGSERIYIFLDADDAAAFRRGELDAESIFDQLRGLRNEIQYHDRLPRKSDTAEKPRPDAFPDQKTLADRIDAIIERIVPVGFSYAPGWRTFCTCEACRENRVDKLIGREPDLSEIKEAGRSFFENALLVMPLDRAKRRTERGLADYLRAKYGWEG